mmetsp:Transcript_9213/g.19129  ORF Transcript_9213/g.19129 Transcript_9213/m.19129 type:complete len:111 (+) Transcript_9213:178-510(+)
MTNKDIGSYVWSILRDRNLSSGLDRYDHLLAAAADEDLVVAWAVWSSIAYFVFGFVLLVFIAILRIKSARKNPFNLYLVYLMIPDMVFSGGCATTCLLNAIKGEFWSKET